MYLGKWQIHPTANKLVADDSEVSLEPRVMDALVMLVNAAPDVVSSDDLLDALWSGRIVESSSLHRLINKLRKAIGDKPGNPTFIETVPKRGYRAIAEVVQVPQPDSGLIPDNAELTISLTPLESPTQDVVGANWKLGIGAEVMSILTTLNGVKLVSEEEDRTSKTSYEMRGSVRSFGTIGKVHTRLLRASGGQVVWAGSFEFNPKNAHEQEQLGAAIAHRLHSEMLFDQQREHALSKYKGTKHEAARQHLKAQNHLRLTRLGGRFNWDIYRLHLESAIELDRNFTAAYFDLCQYYSQRLDLHSLEESTQKAKAAITRAIELEPNSFTGHYELGRVQMNLELDYQGARDSFTRALELSPGHKYCYFNLARIAIRLGEASTCRKMLNIACELDIAIGDPMFLAAAGGYFAQIGDTKKGLKLLDQALSIVRQGDQRVWLLGMKGGIVAWMTEQFDKEQLVSLLNEMDSIEHEMPDYYVAPFYALCGWEQKARAALNDLPDGNLNHAFLAMGYFQIGEFEKGFDWLRKGVHERVDYVLDGIRIGQSWDAVRERPEFKEILSTLERMEHSAPFAHQD